MLRKSFIAVSLFLFVLLPAGCLGKVAYENKNYAAAYFAEIEYETVLASRRWHQLGVPTWACTYAIVEIPANSPKRPPDTWAQDWRATPAVALGDTTRDAIDSCKEHWSQDTHGRIVDVLTKPGSYYQRDGVGETVHLYAPAQKIAARIRFGD